VKVARVSAAGQSEKESATDGPEGEEDDAEPACPPQAGAVRSAPRSVRTRSAFPEECIVGRLGESISRAIAVFDAGALTCPVGRAGLGAGDETHCPEAWRARGSLGTVIGVSAAGPAAIIEYCDASRSVDLEQLARLFESAGWHHRTRDRERLAQMVRGSMYGVSAHDGERLVGYARAISDGAFNAYVSTVTVLPEYQRRGIGREMMRRLLDGREHVQFVLHAASEVHPFYVRCGFSHAPDMLRRDRRH
jgi:GNAT superfamily N-acetyltransferase